MKAAGYWLVVFGPDAQAVGRAQLNCETDQEAQVVAFCTASPFGHELWSEHGFLGKFEIALSMEDDPETTGL